MNGRKLGMILFVMIGGVAFSDADDENIQKLFKYDEDKLFSTEGFSSHVYEAEAIRGFNGLKEGQHFLLKCAKYAESSRI